MLPTRKSVPRSSRQLDGRRETQTAVVWICFPFIRSSQNRLAGRQTEEEVGRQHREIDRPGVRQVPEGSGEQGKMEKTGCKIICGAPTTLAVKGLIMMMMMMIPSDQRPATAPPTAASLSSSHAARVRQSSCTTEWTCARSPHAD